MLGLPVRFIAAKIEPFGAEGVPETIDSPFAGFCYKIAVKMHSWKGRSTSFDEAFAQLFQAVRFIQDIEESPETSDVLMPRTPSDDSYIEVRDILKLGGATFLLDKLGAVEKSGARDSDVTWIIRVLFFEISSRKFAHGYIVLAESCRPGFFDFSTIEPGALCKDCLMEWL